MSNSSTNNITLVNSISAANESVTSQTQERQKPRTIKRLVSRIKYYGKTSDDFTLIAAMDAAELKQRLIAGECGDEGRRWMTWMVVHIEMSKSHLYQLIDIGSAKDPKAEIEVWRREARERSKKRNEKALEAEGDELSENHRLFIKAIKKLSDSEAKDEYCKFYPRYQSRLN